MWQNLTRGSLPVLSPMNEILLCLSLLDLVMLSANSYETGLTKGKLPVCKGLKV